MPGGLEPFLFEAGVSCGWRTGIQISLKTEIKITWITFVCCYWSHYIDQLWDPSVGLKYIHYYSLVTQASVVWLSAHERVLLRTVFHLLDTKIHQHLSKFVSERFFSFILKMLNLKCRLIVIGAYTKLPLRPPCVHMLQFSDSERQSLVYRKQFLISVL